jgi:hypothetical protein
VKYDWWPYQYLLLYPAYAYVIPEGVAVNAMHVRGSIANLYVLPPLCGYCFSESLNKPPDPQQSMNKRILAPAVSVKWFHRYLKLISN